jgi:hypothetical protein
MSVAISSLKSQMRRQQGVYTVDNAQFLFSTKVGGILIHELYHEGEPRYRIFGSMLPLTIDASFF